MIFVFPTPRFPRFPVTRRAAINPIIVSVSLPRTRVFLTARKKPVVTTAVEAPAELVPPERPAQTTNANAFQKHVHPNSFIVVKIMMTDAEAPSPVPVFALLNLPVVRGFVEVLPLPVPTTNALPFQEHKEKGCTRPEAVEAMSVTSPT